LGALTVDKPGSYELRLTAPFGDTKWVPLDVYGIQLRRKP